MARQGGTRGQQKKNRGKPDECQRERRKQERSAKAERRKTRQGRDRKVRAPAAAAAVVQGGGGWEAPGPGEKSIRPGTLDRQRSPGSSPPAPRFLHSSRRHPRWERRDSSPSLSSQGNEPRVGARACSRLRRFRVERRLARETVARFYRSAVHAQIARAPMHVSSRRKRSSRVEPRSGGTHGKTTNFRVTHEVGSAGATRWQA